MKLLHFADVHLGMENYGRINPQTGLNTRFEDGMKCLSFIVDAALQENVDAAIFAGDAYRNCDPNPTHQHGFASQMRRLADAGIPLIMVPGNHDMPISFGRKTAIDIFAALGRDNVHVLTQRRIHTLSTRGGDLQVAPFPWPIRSNLMAQDEYRGASEDELIREIEKRSSDAITALAAEVKPELPCVFIGHVMADRAETSGSEYYTAILRDPRISTAVLANPAFDYVALGHVHKHQDLNKNLRPPVVYSGSMDIINFGEARDTKGFCLVTIEEASDGSSDVRRQTSYEFVPTPTRAFVSIKCDIESGEEPTEAVLKAIERKREKLAGAVVRVVYDTDREGEIDLNMKEIQRALSEAFLVDSIARAPRQTEERARRTDMTEALSWPEALKKYVDYNNEMKPYLPEIETQAARIETALDALKKV